MLIDYWLAGVDRTGKNLEELAGLAAAELGVSVTLDDITAALVRAEARSGRTRGAVFQGLLMLVPRTPTGTGPAAAEPPLDWTMTWTQPRWSGIDPPGLSSQ